MSKSKKRRMGVGKVVAWVAGIVATIISGVVVVWLTTGNPSSEGPGYTVEIPTPTADTPVSQVWKEGDLTLPVSISDRGQAADLDAGRLLQLGTSISASDADIIVRQAVHGVVVEPGLSKGDGVTFDARFTGVNDRSVGRDGCAAAAISPQTSNHLELTSDIDVGSHICMVTTHGRLAEFEIVSIDLSSATRDVQIAFVVWVRE